LRQFFQYRRRFDPAGFVPGREWAPQPAQSDFVPHVLSLDQVRALIEEAGHLRDRHARPVIRILILILYCTGLRFGALVRRNTHRLAACGRPFRT
jgi:integrase/recombinase XerD